ncbi:MAG TPA: iron chelate uptake ABC transporter family permease subunit [Solirubrobacteraceae bacterium]|jgi:zinc/manganese transport system permease protein
MNANPTLSLDLVSDVRELVAFPFMVHALEAGTIVAVLAASVGWYMVLRRQTFAGHTLSLMAFPGATGAALAGLPVSLGYYLACGAAALAMGRTTRTSTRGFGSETAVIGTVQTVGLGAGYLFLSLNSAVLTGTETLLFGTFLGVTQGQVVALLVIAAAALIVLAIGARPLLFATVDRDLAHASGVPVGVLDAAFLLLLAVAVAATSQITGVLLVFAVLVAPPATAQLITTRPLRSLLLSVVFALLIVWLGLGVAYFSIYPVGFYTTTFAFGLYVAVRVTRWALAGAR